MNKFDISSKQDSDSKPKSAVSLVKRILAKKLFKRGLIVLVIVLALIPMALKGWEYLFSAILEKHAPVIVVGEYPKGGGDGNSITVPIALSDVGAGLDEVKVQARQGGSSQVIFKKDFDFGIFEENVSIVLDGKALKFREGVVQFEVTAFDRSFFSNKSTLSFEVFFDYTQPKISAVTLQHNLVRGGVGMVFYRSSDSNPGEHGVQVGTSFFKGYPASDWDSAFIETPGMYFAFFAIPLSFDPNQDRVQLIAKDAVGNQTTASMNFRVRNLRNRERKLAIELGFLDLKVSKHYQKLIEYKAALDASIAEDYSAPTSAEERVRRFKLISQDYRAITEKRLAEIFLKSEAKRYWSGVFSRYGFGTKRYWFGDTVSYEFKGEVLGSYIETGAELVSGPEVLARAANGGKVVFAGDMGMYGDTVIVDHGFGLTSIYSNLSYIACRIDQVLESGDPIGKYGASGFNSGQHLQFEMRLQGVPVRPIEWWDQSWITDHIENRVRDLKKQLGMKDPEDLI